MKMSYKIQFSFLVKLKTSIEKSFCLQYQENTFKKIKHLYIQPFQLQVFDKINYEGKSTLGAE